MEVLDIVKRINEFYDKLNSTTKLIVIIAVASNIFWPLVSGSIILKLLGVVILVLAVGIRVISKFGGKDEDTGRTTE